MRRLGSLLIALCAAACRGGVALEEVPAAPIAHVRQSADSISGLEEFLDAVELVGPGTGSEGRSRPLHASIALLTVPEGQIRAVPDAEDGSYPLDWSSDGLTLLVGRDRRRGLELLEWNRLTGAWGRLSADLSLGPASLGTGPIRLAWVGSANLGSTGPDAPRTGIWLDVDREGKRLLPGGAAGSDPDVSPDGRRVLFTRSHPRGNREPVILLAELGGAEPRPIARGEQPKFSRDGEWVVFVSHRRGNADVWMMRSNGSAKRPVVTSGFDDEFPTLSPDNRFVVYASARERDVSQLYMTRLADGVEVQLTHTGQSGRPVW